MGRLVQAAKQNDKRSMLEATRDILAYSVETCGSMRDLAALTKRLIEIQEMIDALPDPTNANPVDELAAQIAEYDEYEDPRFDGEDDDGS